MGIVKPLKIYTNSFLLDHRLQRVSFVANIDTQPNDITDRDIDHIIDLLVM